MAKVLIVDDEEWIRLGLREQIQWDKLGLTIIGEAQNGIAAVEIIEEKKPEIVITDIRMPKMDGIALMEYIHKNYPDMIIVVISGYSEFEYAKKAISFSAFEYILKPIEEEVLESTLTKAVEKINEKRNQKDNLINLKVKLHENSRLIREKILTDLVLSTDSSFEEIEKNAGRMGVRFSGSRMAVLVFKAANFKDIAYSHYDNDVDLASFALSNVIEELAGDSTGAVLFRNYIKHDEIVLIKGFDTDEYHLIVDNIYMTGKTIIETVKSWIGFEIYVGVGGEFTNLKNVGKSYEQAVEAVQNAGMMQDNRIVHFDEISSRNEYFIFPDDKEKAFLYYIENNYKSQASGLIDKLFTGIGENKGTNPQSIRSSVLEFVISIGRLLKKHSCTIEGQMQDKNPVDKIMNELFTAGELKEWFKDLAFKAMNAIENGRKTGSKKTVVQIVEYIDKHYGEGINLNSVSAQFYINSAYLSRIFKNEIGQNFNDYLSKKRMEAAVELLKQEELRMNDIAEMVGYENVNYFLKRFKEYYNCTPTEYRKKLSQ